MSNAKSGVMLKLDTSDVQCVVKQLSPRTVTEDEIRTATESDVREIAMGLWKSHKQLVESISQERSIYEKHIAALEHSTRVAIEERDRVVQSVKSERVNFARAIELKDQQIAKAKAEAKPTHKKRRKNSCRKPSIDRRPKYEIGSLRE